MNKSFIILATRRLRSWFCLLVHDDKTNQDRKWPKKAKQGPIRCYMTNLDMIGFKKIVLVSLNKQHKTKIQNIIIVRMVVKDTSVMLCLKINRIRFLFSLFSVNLFSTINEKRWIWSPDDCTVHLKIAIEDLALHFEGCVEGKTWEGIGTSNFTLPKSSFLYIF